MPPRPDLEPELRALLDALVRAAPARLGHIDVERILVVAASARKDAHASIRPLSFGGHPPRYASADGRLHKPRIQRAGCELLYEIALRPRFFLDADARERVGILAHELHHVSPRFDGTLAEERRHRSLAPGEHERAVQEIVGAWEGAGCVGLHAVEGPREVTLLAWRSRPPSRLLHPGRERALYTEQDLYPAIVHIPH